MTPETLTPRTDAQPWINRYPEYHEGATRWVTADFARQLERELAELRKNASELIASLQTETDSVERELAEVTQSLAFQTQLNRELIEREKQTFAELAAEREQVAILRSDEKRLVAFAKTYRMNAEILSDKLAAERELADRLAIAIEQVLPAFGAGGDLSKAWDTWNKARK